MIGCLDKVFTAQNCVWYAWKYAGIDISPERTTIVLPFLPEEMIFPQNILSSAAISNALPSGLFLVDIFFISSE